MPHHAHHGSRQRTLRRATFGGGGFVVDQGADASAQGHTRVPIGDGVPASLRELRCRTGRGPDVSAAIDVRLFRPADSAAVVELVLGIQNDELHLGLSICDQSHLEDIDSYYLKGGGTFMVAATCRGSAQGVVGGDAGARFVGFDRDPQLTGLRPAERAAGRGASRLQPQRVPAFLDVGQERHFHGYPWCQVRRVQSDSPMTKARAPLTRAISCGPSDPRR